MQLGNPDQAMIQRFLANPQVPLAIDSNPMALALGSTLHRVDRAAGEVEIGYAPQPLFIQGTGVIQGGAVTAMLDFAMAFVTLASIDPSRSCATVNLNTTFLRPAPQGDYIAVGTLERCGKAMAFTHARLLRAHDRVCVATASSSLALI